jgi:hypothetical protein
MAVLIWVGLPVALAVLGAAVIAYRSSDAPLRRILTLLAIGGVIGSGCTYLYMWSVAMRVSSLPLAARADAIFPWIGRGFILTLAVLVVSAFAVRGSRFCLVCANVVLLFLWVGSGMGY